MRRWGAGSPQSKGPEYPHFDCGKNLCIPILWDWSCTSKSSPPSTTLARGMEATIFSHWIYRHLKPHAERLETGHSARMKATGGLRCVVFRELRSFRWTKYHSRPPGRPAPDRGDSAGRIVYLRDHP